MPPGETLSLVRGRGLHPASVLKSRLEAGAWRCPGEPVCPPTALTSSEPVQCGRCPHCTWPPGPGELERGHRGRAVGSPHSPCRRVGGLSLCWRSSFLLLNALVTCVCNKHTERRACVCGGHCSVLFPDPGRGEPGRQAAARWHVQVRCWLSVPAHFCFEAEGTCHYVLYVSLQGKGSRRFAVFHRGDSASQP